MHQQVADYIRQNREKYTRDAIRAQLIAAGHDPAVVDEALQQAEVAAAPPRTGWRLGMRTSLLLVILGAIGAGLIWQTQLYSAGAIAAIIYAVVAAIALLVGKGISVLVERGSTGSAVILLALIGGIGALLLLNGNAGLLAGVAVLAAGGVAAALLILRRINPPGARILGTTVPILFWLVVTGTCYSPIFGPRVAQPTTKAGMMDLQIGPPLSFTGSGGATCVIYTSGFSVNSEDLGKIGDLFMSVSIGTAGDPNAPASSGGGDRSVTLSIGLNSPSGRGYVTYGKPGDATFSMHPAADGVSGTVAFDGLVRQTAEGPAASGADPGPLSGTITWTCA